MPNKVGDGGGGKKKRQKPVRMSSAITLLDNKNGPQHLNINSYSKTCPKHESKASFSVSGQIFEKIEHLRFSSKLNLKAVKGANWTFFCCFIL